MIELASTVIITMLSTLLFGYWFRYTCLLILSAKTTRDYACDVATANQLSFLRIQSELRQAMPSDLERLHASLDRDYDVLKSLLKQTLGLEERMLQLNYRLMGVWCSAARKFSPSAARKALDEMTLVLAHFANSMGEQACAAAA